MLRFILKQKWRDCHNGAEGEGFSTLDIEVPELEAELRSGGFSEHSYSMKALVGVEVLTGAQRAGKGEA